MPRPKKDTDAPAKTRSRKGCWPCKSRKVKCDEGKPSCGSCVKSGQTCDYSLRLNWGGRSKKGTEAASAEVGEGGGGVAGSAFDFQEHVFSAQHISTATTPKQGGARRAVKASSGQTQQGGPGQNGEGAGLAQGMWNGDGSGNCNGKRHFLLDPQLPRAMTATPTPSDPFNFPPYSGSSARSPAAFHASKDFSWSAQHSAKRLKRTSAGQDDANSPVFAVPRIPPQHDLQTQPSPGSSAPTPQSINSIINAPATPGTSTQSASPYPQAAATHQPREPADLRRLSVKSLLSDEPECPRHHRADSSHTYNVHGYDHGLADLDIPRNADFDAVSPRSPGARRKKAATSPETSSSDEEPDTSHMAFEPGGYYAQPVPIRIPKALEPLHPELNANPMNLLYFHHFINHTGRITVPHDCPDNPFRTVLPQMAMRNTQLLHLLLAFSASHRARLLCHAEPANRIAAWMADVFPALRQALELSTPTHHTGDPTDPTPLAPLATALLLASREIISPNNLDPSIPWQDHLQIARRMIIAKGGLHHLAHRSHGARDKTIFFLSRWFAYLDVFGSLSGNKHHGPLSDAYLEDGSGLWLVNRDNEEVFKIDCFFGFSGRCIALLAQVAELASECDRHRIDPITISIRTAWEPSDLVRQRTEDLRKRLEASATNVYQGCPHSFEPSPPTPNQPYDSEQLTAEIYATNTLFHLAGLLHLHRRCLNHPSSSPQIQQLVTRTLQTLQHIRHNSTAETCLLFPIFTAGCEALGTEQREVFMSRLTAVEGWGMEQIARARSLMGRVWETGRAWETLVQGEFFG